MVFESYERLNSERKCFVPLPNGDTIINGTLMDNNFVPKSTKEVAIQGFEGDFSSCRSFWNNKNLNPAYKTNVVQAGVETYLNVDVSTDAPVFGFPTAQDPKTGEIFISGNYGVSTTADNVLLGDEVLLRSTSGTTDNVRVVDVSDDFWYIVCSYNLANYGGYLYAVNKKTLARTNLYNFNTSNNHSWGYVPQILYRDETYFVYVNTGTIIKVNKENNSVTTLSNFPGKPTFPAAVQGGQTSCPYTPKVNGWHISVNPYTAQTNNKELILQALKIDVDANKYELVSNVPMNSVNDRCDENVKTMTIFSGLGTAAATYYHIWKIDEKTLGILKMPNLVNGVFASVNNKQFPAYYILSLEYDEEDQSVPPTFTLENAQLFDKTYPNNPILISPTKFALCVPEIGIDIFSYDATKKEFVKTTSFDCNGLSSACYHNGFIWWYDNTNKQIHYEIEGETYILDESYDKDVYEADENGQATGTYSISVRNGNGERVEKQVKLEPLTGIFTFGDGSMSKTITTSADKDTDVPIKVMSAPGRVIMKVTLVG